jgi:arginyl-tRNA--protein-N-Asp/Glu arginylyltransferase
MLAEHYYPLSFSSYELDEYLAKGWFRGSISMYRSDFLCLEESLQTVINIRLPLQNHTFKKKQRRITKHVMNRFQVKTQPFQNSLQKEMLYRNHRHRFKGFLHHDLHSYMNGQEGRVMSEEIFDTYEVSVYEEDKLIAFSLFDLGSSSMASILGVFDNDYAAYSLGTFTMLKEIEYGMENSFQYYYPGYTLHDSTWFDYKLRLGKMEFYYDKKEWQPIEKLENVYHTSDAFKDKMITVQELADIFEVPHKMITYPGFSFAYFDFDTLYYLRSPWFMILFNDKIENDAWVIEYWSETEEYVVSKIEIAVKFDLHDQLQMSESALNSPTNCLDLLRYKVIYLKDKNPYGLLMFLLNARSQEIDD